MLERELLQTRKLAIREISLPARMDQILSIRGDTSRYFILGLRRSCSRYRGLDPVVWPAGGDIRYCVVDDNSGL